MLDTFKYTVLSMLRNKGILVWALAFPIVLSTCFLFMFGELDDLGDVEAIPTVVVTDEAYDDSPAFQQFIGALGSNSESEGDEGKSALLAVKYAASSDEALSIMRSSEGTDDPYAGYVTLPEAESPELHVQQGVSSMQSIEGVDRSILVTFMDTFVSRAEFISGAVEDNPEIFTDPGLVQSLFGVPDATEKVDLTANAPVESVRYYFALMGMAALFGAQVALSAVIGLLPNMGPLGARRAVAGVRHDSALAGAILASWVVSFVCLLIAYAYIRVVCGVDFAGRDVSCLLVLAVSSLTATSLGAALAVIPKLPESSKSGILTGVVCLCALFAGLYGQPTMELADTVAAAFPASQFVNPAVQISQALFSLMYYDTMVPCLQHMGVLIIMCVVLFALSAHTLRRQRYASI